MIAGYLVHEFAAATIANLWLGRLSLDCSVDTSLCVWAHYTIIDGLRYIAKLSNADDNELGVQIFDPTLQKADTIYIQEDYNGIRQLVFTNQDKPLPAKMQNSRRDHWWRTVLLHKTLHTESDVRVRLASSC
jgi:hypothetical protein